MHLKEEMPVFTSQGLWINEELKTDDLIGGKPTLIHFWSISCHLCKLEMPLLNELRETFQKKINVVAVHIPRSSNDQDITKIKEVVKEHHMTQSIFLDQDLTLADAYENEYVPAYYLFDKKGKLRHFQAGARGMDLLTKRIKRILSLEKMENNE